MIQSPSIKPLFLWAIPKFIFLVLVNFSRPTFLIDIHWYFIQNTHIINFLLLFHLLGWMAASFIYPPSSNLRAIYHFFLCLDLIIKAPDDSCCTSVLVYFTSASVPYVYHHIICQESIKHGMTSQQFSLPLSLVLQSIAAVQELCMNAFLCNF